MVYNAARGYDSEVICWDGETAFPLSEYGQIASHLVVICDPNTEKLCYPKLQLVLPRHHLIIVSGEEQDKNLSTLQLLWEKFYDLQLDRKAHLILLGGGSLLDLVAFAASSYLRGVRFDLVPTTLLAMVDASYGGKTGINFRESKNIIGSFAPADQVILSPIWLDSLPSEALNAGEAELLKHFLIADAASFWAYMKAAPQSPRDIFDWVMPSLAIKINLVHQDPYEQLDKRALLNLGHTVGHALESFFRHHEPQLPHGLAVAAGIAIETQIAANQALITNQEADEFLDVWLEKFPLPGWRQEDWPHLIPFLLKDKKNTNGAIRMALLTKIGQATFPVSVTQQEIQSALEAVYSRH